MVLEAESPHSREEWIRVPISRIEDLSDAVYGAGLEATQMTTGGVSGTGTSQRTLSQAFVEVLGDTPGNYVRRQRLHRIRRDLMFAADGCAIARIAAKWGLTEPGRMSGWYREVFGELPSATRAASLTRRRMTAEWL